jgi:hypothetical protein|tara:strand:+ start:5050 stop:5937 length:888 start_codon:yes stop_codon:yes gene_type:complete
MKALIDADIIVYWSANHCQTNYYNVIDKDGEVLQEYDSKRHAQNGLEDINTLWKLQASETEESPYSVVSGKIIIEPWSECVEFITDFIKSLVKKTKADEYELHLSGHTNFRKDIAVTKPYKGNRKGYKPFYYQKVRDYLIEELGALVSEDEEADDTLAIAQTNDKDNTIICTIDKDLWTVPGAKYDFKREESSYVTEYDGIRHFQYQMLAGDPVDNIQGVPKIGPVKAKKILGDYDDIQTTWNIIRDYYKDSYGDDCNDIMLEMGRLLWIRHNVGEMWDLPLFENELDKKEETNG